MLEPLDNIPRDKLVHYGEIGNFLDLIRALASPNQEVYNNTLSVLWDTIIHQGTVFNSAAYVVPFLFELLEAPDVHCKNGLLYLLADIFLKHVKLCGTGNIKKGLAICKSGFS